MDTVPAAFADAPAPGAADPQRHALPIRFVASGSEYFRIWIVNLLLVLVTLTLYYPFAKARRMRYFHNATEVGGHPLSFHGDPWKMFRGYVLVAVMVLLYSLASQFSVVGGLVAFVIIALVWPALWHASLQFRLANTGWRGLRGRFVGPRGGAYRTMLPLYLPALVIVGAGVFMPREAQSPAAEAQAAAQAGLAGGAILLAMAVLALAMPWMLWAIKRYQHGHYAVADELLRFQRGAGAFYGVFLRAVGLFLVPVIAAGVLIAMVMPRDGDRSAAATAIVAGTVAVLLLVLAAQVALKPYFTSRLQNLVWNGTAGPQLSFESRLRFRSLFGLTLLNWLLILLTLGLYYPFAAVATARLRLQAVTVHSTIPPDDFVSSQAGRRGDAAGDAAGDLLGIDFGL